MRGYASREPQKAAPLTVRPETSMSLFSVADAIDLLSRLGKINGKQYYRLNSAWSGVTWVAAENVGGIWKPTAVLAVMGLQYKFLEHEVHPIPIEQFIGVPLMLQAAFKVGLIVRFADSVAATVISSKMGDITELVAGSRIGDTLDGSEKGSLVADISCDKVQKIDLN